MHEISDFRSDTVTRPTPEMYEAMRTAPLGDDVLGDEPTVRKLEKMVADMLGKEAALYLPSGTQSNQVAIALHCQRGQEVICEFLAHTYNNESGAIAYVAGAQVRPIHGKRGVMDPTEVQRMIRPVNVHQPRTALVSVENTSNAHGGAVVPLDNILAIAEVVKKHPPIKFHLDGARLWNAHVATGIPLRQWCAPFDTVSVCLSKGLCSPVGSVLAGPRDDIERARYLRKQLGGGMRQSGVLAACGIISVTKMIDRLQEDHAKARRLAEGIMALKGVDIDMAAVQTNIVNFGVAGREREFEGWRKRLQEERVLALHLNNRWRFVTHNDVDHDDVDRAIKALRGILG